MSGGDLVPLEAVPAVLEQHRAALAALADPVDVAKAERRVAALVELAKRAELAVPIINAATFLRAEHLEKLAELVDEGQARGELEQAGGDRRSINVRGSDNDRPASLGDVGVDRRRVAEGRALGRTGAVSAVRDDPRRRPDRLVSMRDLLKQAERREREDGARVVREEQEAVARAELAHDPKRAELVVADVHAWRPAGVAAIVTDPPYLGDAIPLYRALRDFAVDVLPAGGALVVMAAHWLLADVFDALRHDRLAYRTTIAWRFDNVERVMDRDRRVFPTWKPVLVYHLGAMPAGARVLRNEVTSAAPDKEFHAWGQSLDGFARLVDGVTNAGELVCDPFLGGGTTAAAALMRARRFVGADIDADAVETTRARLAEAA